MSLNVPPEVVEWLPCIKAIKDFVSGRGSVEDVTLCGVGEDVINKLKSENIEDVREAAREIEDKISNGNVKMALENFRKATGKGLAEWIAETAFRARSASTPHDVVKIALEALGMNAGEEAIKIMSIFECLKEVKGMMVIDKKCAEDKVPKDVLNNIAAALYTAQMMSNALATQLI